MSSAQGSPESSYDASRVERHRGQPSPVVNTYCWASAAQAPTQSCPADQHLHPWPTWSMAQGMRQRTSLRVPNMWGKVSGKEGAAW